MRPQKAARKPVPYYNRRKVGFLHWEWSFTDGRAGRQLLTPRRALTERAAYRQATAWLRALETPTVAACAHALNPVEAHAICAVLHAVEHIDVAVQLRDGVAYVHPAKDALSTLAEVTALRAFAAVSDRVVWDGPR